jgi:HEAT repeat protein
MVRPLLIALAVCLLSLPALAHGSSYRGPSSEVPPGLRAPDPVPPPDPSVSSSGAGSWEWWWSTNKEAFLYPHSGKSRGSREKPGNLDEVFASFTKALKDPMSCPERSRVAIAAGCLAASRSRLPDPLRDRLIELAKDGGQQSIVQTSCALALGLSQRADPTILSTLVDLLQSGSTRAAVRGGAALALGFLPLDPAGPAQRRRTAAFTRMLESTQGGELGACLLLAMGLSGDRTYLPSILDVAEKTGSPRFQAYALTALGKMAEDLPEVPADEIVPVLCRQSTAKRDEAARAAITSLGLWCGRPATARGAQLAAVEHLARAVAEGKPADAGTARIALARIGAASRFEDVRERALGPLLTAEPTGEEGAIAALALGIFSRSECLAGRDRLRVLETLRPRLTVPSPPPPGDSTVACSAEVPPGQADPPDPVPPPPVPASAEPPGRSPVPPPASPAPPPKVERAAVALALALAGDRESVPALRALLEDEAAKPRLRGYAAVALGLLGDRGTSTRLRKAVRAATNGDLLVLGSLGGGLLRDRYLKSALLPMLDGSGKSRHARSLVARALGKLGDRRALGRLRAVLDDSSVGGGLRSAAAVAVADLYDREGALVLTRLTRDLDGSSLLETLRLVFNAL